ncbi:carotenoid oxygenase family protein [Alkalicella caledoniensis]|uniref:Carotenoid oxygenase family protein n=1 Tax=Alkalicella caledoniensis TaxID=2731377 RepID=A0A7G9W9R9_ALKCA|nr:carotenoid oxygenase family protein [Alkalicella caledoniensis]QNO15431.1 carotenoid oxygenase family protein [Alkalicella caledoniensis]
MKINVALGFTTLEEEIDNIALPIQGNIPQWLTGTLIRNGAAKFEVEKDSYNHWFDGLAMLHRFDFNQGKILYTNKFLRGSTYKESMIKGTVVYPEFATLPKTSMPSRILRNATGHFTDNASVNVAKIDNKYIALTETPPRVEFDPLSLRTLGRFSYGDKVKGHLTTVHPHYDYKNKQIFNYITKFSLISSYNIYSISEGSTKRKIISSVPVKHPSYMHSFGMTDNYIILTQFPLIVDHFRLLRTGSAVADNLKWRPERGTHFLIIDKISGKVIGKFECEPFFGFHHINCFEIDGNVVVDIDAYSDSTIVRSLYLEDLRQGDFLLPTPQIIRYHLQLGSNNVTTETIWEDFAEFPRLNYERCNGKAYNYVYGLNAKNSNGFPNRLVKFSTKNSYSNYWFMENNYPGEPIFIPSPENRVEDEGVVLSMILDTELGKTYLLILDVTSFTEIARAYLPFPVPFGSHGQYFP